MSSQSLRLAAIAGPRNPLASFRWTSIPLEIRLLILQSVITECRGIKQAAHGQKSTSLASLASVCKDWQALFERHTFRRLDLDDKDLMSFANLTGGKNIARLDYIRQLWLRIELSAYTCLSCHKQEAESTIIKNRLIFKSSFTLLLHVLSRWTPNRDGGLTLEISAHSPSDTEHYYRNLLDFDRQKHFHLEEDLQRSPGLVEYTRQRQAELNSRKNRHRLRLTLGAAQRFQGAALALNSWRPLPVTPIVKGLCLRPHFFRGIALRTLGKIFRDSFINMTSFRFERWTSVDFREEYVFFLEFLEVLIHAFPHRLKVFSFNQWAKWEGCHRSIPETLHINPLLIQAVVTSYYKLTDLCPPWQLSTQQFLTELGRAGTRPCEKPNLELLCLEFRSLHPAKGQGYFTDILVLAAKAATAMPKLRTLEIWNAGPGYGFLFRYTLHPHQATVTWRSTQKAIALEPGTIEAWMKVASDHEVQLLVEMEPFHGAEQEGMIVDGKIMYRHLVLARLAIHPVTLAHFEAERTLRETS
ncbi:hypothetical protein EDB81DRAFT_898368 [Dactylonectria macrodidyma]|uniref:DUF6546 domain-containing protein n=1 Tax=Dactylonectria macrodidyma TaxID=307937 RepID=A0A9P9JJF9_9HYPO|nr:hypothetical protein EDB81DRAFT_898368 [Dactylonectria macrodidyma]